MTRLVNADGRATILLPSGAVDVAAVSDFPSDIQALYGVWDSFVAWVASASLAPTGPRPVDSALGSPVPAPRQIVGVGINYRSSLDAKNFVQPSTPGVFSKFATSVAGPFDPIRLTGDTVITEVEIGVVIGRTAVNVSESDALAHVAGVTTAQDLIDGASVIGLTTADGGRGPSYMDLGKSRPGFAPLGPELVTLDEAGNLDDLEIELIVDGVHWQKASSSELLFKIPSLIALISAQIPLLPGDVILTGSPYWLPVALNQPLRAGSEVVARVGELGVQRKTVA